MNVVENLPVYGVHFYDVKVIIIAAIVYEYMPMVCCCCQLRMC